MQRCTRALPIRYYRAEGDNPRPNLLHLYFHGAISDQSGAGMCALVAGLHRGNCLAALLLVWRCRGGVLGRGELWSWLGIFDVRLQRANP